MKTNLGVAVICVGLTGLVMWVGREEEKANAENVPVFTDATPALGKEAADSKVAGAKATDAGATPAAPVGVPAVGIEQKSSETPPGQPGLDTLLLPSRKT